MTNNGIMARMEIETLTGKSRKRWSVLFVSLIVLFSAVCMYMMNINYDSLARYPYSDQTSRQLIKKYLNKEEIEYIIEYSIAPNMFVAYIKEDGFNIYHAAEYKKLSEFAWDKSAADIVQMVEETRNVMDTDTLITYLQNYTYDVIRNFITNGDTYDSKSWLIINAASTELYLGPHDTVGTRVPFSLVQVDPAIIANQGIQVEADVNQPLQTMCEAIQTETGSSRPCGGLNLDAGYISYERQVGLYDKALTEYGSDAVSHEPYPGHNEHQLGLAVDFSVPGIQDADFDRTLQGQWLNTNAWRFGFVRPWDRLTEEITGMVEQPYHYRYVGFSLASSLHEKGQTFASYETSLKTATATSSAEN